MTLFHLQLAVDSVENVAKIEVPDSFVYCFDMRQSNGQDLREKVTFTRLSEEDIPRSRGKCHLALKFGDQITTLKIEDQKKITKKEIDLEDGVGTYVTICSMDCRGMEPVKYHMGNDFVVIAKSGHRFEEVDLSDAWCDYDPKGEEPVSIGEVKYKIVVGK
eukprot:Blabericola_migrator_1__3210@NODE_1945_length_3520_cov_157_498697_g1243_i0_p4_GENE_NODE_1945_length_3520_cov_157_498697_g1243_i0NODE_1945_length_3520_cov_157_498697_g1243_i0_p4_ORF_typecomplete_len161_score49_25DUF866/PF05907_13/4_7e29_NODE_1945_length_3520_cov_157_498697_g1243_i023042786